eukprot:XP_011665915.1 PREDICTED: deleted in malignant brain tumors 1 protein-like [Strongylocentrotus purpuratus]
MVYVRLVDGASANEGRVEVNYEGSWGTICDDSWDIKDATVVCRMLGYPGVSSALVRFGEATGDIILDNVDCDGAEKHIAQCTHSGYEIHNCDHSGDVGIICSGEAELNVRLVGGPDESQGRLELFYFGSWGTVCHLGWTSLDSEVVCRMLGFVGAITYSNHLLYGPGTGEVILREPRCSGKESSLLECDPYYNMGYTYCGHTTDLGVSCLKMDDLRVRLIGGRSDKEGRVEILYLGTWGTVCDDNWDLSDANVVCRMLGYERAENFSCCAAFGLGPGPIVLDEVECEGTEANIGHCRRSDYETHDCDHSEDVGVLSGPEILYNHDNEYVVLYNEWQRLANEASSQQQGKYPQTVNKNCYNGPQQDEEGYMELNAVPHKQPEGSSRDHGEVFKTPRPDDNEDGYENIKI